MLGLEGFYYLPKLTSQMLSFFTTSGTLHCYILYSMVLNELFIFHLQDAIMVIYSIGFVLSWVLYAVLVSQTIKGKYLFVIKQMSPFPFCSYFWGWLADKFGRRPIVVVSLSLLFAGMLGFGLSLSLYTAIVTRFWCGLNSGMSYNI